MPPSPPRVGIELLRKELPPILRGARVGLLAHQASLLSDGRHSAEFLASRPGLRLTRLFGPEHGFFGWGGPGEQVLDDRHPWLHLPVHSLYGEHRTPPPEWLQDLDALIVDLQDLGIRCYTYVSTLRRVLHACAAVDLPVVVADRPIPAPNQVSGPMTVQKSFVAEIEAPLCYGMTPAEAASWLCECESIPVDLHLLPLSGYRREPGHRWRGSPWVPPSPGIRSWHSAYAYPATVFSEAWPTVRVERDGLRPFRVWSMPGLNAAAVCETLRSADLPGCVWALTVTPATGSQLALSLEVSDPDRFPAFAAALHLLCAIRDTHGVSFLWEAEGVRPAFFDALMGTASVREDLICGLAPATVLTRAEAGLADFRAERKRHLLYTR